MTYKFKGIIALFRLGLIIFFFILMVFLINFPEADQLPGWLVHNPLVSYTLKERVKVRGQAAAVTLNDLMPRSYDHLVRFQENNSITDPNSLNQYIYYYQKVVEYLPEEAAAYGTLGFCYFHKGQYDESLACYKKATQFFPNFFWFQYNLGVVYFQRGDYERAQEAFQIALKTKFDISLKFFYASKIYRDILRGHISSEEILKERLIAGYTMGQRMFVLSNHYLKNLAAPRLERLLPKIF